jgi:hypothetical protein
VYIQGKISLNKVLTIKYKTRTLNNIYFTLKMKMVSLLMMKKGDVILLLIVVFCTMASPAISNDSSLDSLTSWSNLKNQINKEEFIATVKKDNVIIKTIDLSKIRDREIIKISGQYSATIAVEHNRICLLDSTCPNKTCVSHGWLSNSGDIAVCLPNKILVKIREKNINDLDGGAK